MRGIQRALERSTETHGLLRFIPQVSPTFLPPKHLEPFLKRLETLREKPLRLVVATPPRHSKTESIIHFIPWLLQRDSRLTVAYVTYASQIARSKSRRARDLAREAGVALSNDLANLDEWRTITGGGMLATGVGGPLTGQGANVLVVDDPIKNRQEAESALIRERTYEWFTSTAFTRLEPNGSAIVVATRWHPEDLSGRLIDEGWEYLNLPAINDLGQALWPERWPVEALRERERQVGPYDWASLYQGQPRPKGGQVFTDAHYYDSLPEGGYKEAWGADWAYTSKSYADHSVALQGRKYGDTLYITDMIRQQTEVPAFLASLKAKGVNRVTSYMSGTEKAIEQFLAREGVTVKRLPATGDKFTRAQPFAAGWNTGRVLLPRNKPWLEPLLAELLSFTGLGDPHDDIVDAGAGLWAELMLEPEKKPSEPMSFSFSSF